MNDHVWAMLTGTMATIGSVVLLMWFYWHVYILVRAIGGRRRAGKERRSNPPYRSQA